MPWKNVEKEVDHPYLPATPKRARLEARISADAKALDQMEFAHCLKISKSRKAISELEGADLDRVKNRMRYLATQLDVTLTPDVFGLFTREIKLRRACAVVEKIQKGLAGERTRNVYNPSPDWSSQNPSRYIDVPIPEADYRRHPHGREYQELIRYMREGGVSAKDLGLSPADFQALAPKKTD